MVSKTFSAKKTSDKLRLVIVIKCKEGKCNHAARQSRKRAMYCYRYIRKTKKQDSYCKLHNEKLQSESCQQKFKIKSMYFSQKRINLSMSDNPFANKLNITCLMAQNGY